MALMSGTFLKSKVAQRIAILLLVAAIIPATLVTGLTYRNMSRLLHNVEQESLVNSSQDYALDAFANLIFARTMLQHFADINPHESTNTATLWDALEEKTARMPIFKSVVQITNQGKIITQHGNANHLATAIGQQNATELDSLKAKNQHFRLLVLWEKNYQTPLISLILPRTSQENTLTIAELNPDFIWGIKSDYPSEINVCAYQTLGKLKSKLFCTQEVLPFKNKQSLPSSSWDLFLKAEFQGEPWTFETTRLKPSAVNKLWDFYSDNGFIWVLVLSLLIIGLLSINQIRRTMVPLEHLIAGTRKISKGQFDQVVINDKSEFSELANAFNHMSSDIQRQLNTLQVLSDVDKKMVAKLDVDYLIEQISLRIQQLKPGAYTQVFRLVETTETEAHCLVNIAHDDIQSTLRVTIPTIEINQLEAYPLGQFVNLETHLHYQSEMLRLGAQHLWVLPIFWQGAICAFLAVGSKSAFNAEDTDWNEIRDLSNRIGIAISAQKREEQLLIQAHHDLLTGLPNRILLDDRLQQAIEQSQRTQLPTWVVFLDLDRFKYINDSMGHHFGDLVLIEISKRLKSAVREIDTIARFGGDEFIIVLQGHANELLVMGVLNRIIESVSLPLNLNQQVLSITCSAGVATYPNDGQTADTLIQHADIAMYRAKELGKNNIQFFTEALNKKVSDRVYMENLLRNALDNNELELHYQPKVNTETMNIVGVEALIRWNSPQLGLVSPVQFIPLAEETGLIFGIGEWIIKTACTQAMAWQKAGFGKLLMSVNLSARQFNQVNLLASIKKILAETGLEAQLLELELTEGMVMTEVTESIKTIHEIKALGIKISVDDFGTGYSSLSYLKELPLDTLKIDKSFIDDILLHTDDAPIVKTIITLAKNLNLKIVAEGVESYEQVLYLKAHGCDEIQGYYFSRPKPAQDFEPLFKKSSFK